MITFYPLEQGLRLAVTIRAFSAIVLITFYPLEQGLRPPYFRGFKRDVCLITFYPLEQGLRHIAFLHNENLSSGLPFIH